MKMAMKEGQILIKEADNTQFTIIKSWGKMKWSKAERMFYGPAEIELLNKLAGIVRLPAPIEAERQRLNIIGPGRRRGAHETGAGTALQIPGKVPPLQAPDQGGKHGAYYFRFSAAAGG